MTHLSQRALHRSQEDRLLQAVVAAVDVVQLEAQTLHLFKIKVQRENLWVGRVDAAADHLRPIHLQDTKGRNNVSYCSMAFTCTFTWTWVVWKLIQGATFHSFIPVVHKYVWLLIFLGHEESWWPALHRFFRTLAGAAEQHCVEVWRTAATIKGERVFTAKEPQIRSMFRFRLYMLSPSLSPGVSLGELLAKTAWTLESPWLSIQPVSLSLPSETLSAF